VLAAHLLKIISTECILDEPLPSYSFAMYPSNSAFNRHRNDLLIRNAARFDEGDIIRSTSCCVGFRAVARSLRAGVRHCLNPFDDSEFGLF
jgi:hypothetical protein